ncbi:MAG: PEF-CTERM sorting domain-containing protein [Halobacteriota archaeon]|nr:PEF-CTERM sorting domain-containing protein [Halobacteriota archaeon]
MIGRRKIIAILIVLSIFGGLVVALPSRNQVDDQPVKTILSSDNTGQYPDIDVDGGVGDRGEDDGSSKTETDANTTAGSEKKTNYGKNGGYSSVGVSSVSNPSPTPDPADPTPDPEDPSPSPDPENPEEIPEFPTVAIPAAMILGLVFLMQRRK